MQNAEAAASASEGLQEPVAACQISLVEMAQGYHRCFLETLAAAPDDSALAQLSSMLSLAPTGIDVDTLRAHLEQASASIKPDPSRGSTETALKLRLGA